MKAITLTVGGYSTLPTRKEPALEPGSKAEAPPQEMMQPPVLISRCEPRGDATSDRNFSRPLGIGLRINQQPAYHLSCTASYFLAIYWSQLITDLCLPTLQKSKWRNPLSSDCRQRDKLPSPISAL